MGLAIGIDIHRDSLTIAEHWGSVWTVPQTAEAMAQLAIRLKTRHPSVIVLEPSGGL